jgi:hypothetical protein
LGKEHGKKKGDRKKETETGDGRNGDRKKMQRKVNA